MKTALFILVVLLAAGCALRENEPGARKENATTPSATSTVEVQLVENTPNFSVFQSPTPALKYLIFAKVMIQNGTVSHYTATNRFTVNIKSVYPTSDAIAEKEGTALRQKYEKLGKTQLLFSPGNCDSLHRNDFRLSVNSALIFSGKFEGLFSKLVSFGVGTENPTLYKTLSDAMGNFGSQLEVFTGVGCKLADSVYRFTNTYPPRNANLIQTTAK